MSKSKIEWTDEVWNPTTGCAKVSAGCKNCYAEKMSKRLAAMGQEKYQGIMTDGGRFNGRVRTHKAELRRPLSWKKPRKVFVNSMSDLFHEDVPFWFIDQVFAMMALTPQHTYQILTKRPDRMAKYLNRGDVVNDIIRSQVDFSGKHPHWSSDAVTLCIRVDHHGNWPLPNVWLGTSVENQAAAEERIPHLLKCPAAVRFLSCEPLLGKVDFGLIPEEDEDERRFASQILSGIHWVIAGGESGPNARPMQPDWVRHLWEQCKVAGVPFFFKQWGEYAAHDRPPIPLRHICKVSFYTEDGAIVPVKPSTPAEKMTSFPIYCKVGKHQSGRLLDGRTHDAFPESTIKNQPSNI